MNSDWAPDPSKHLYTWTFSKRGLLIRYFLWLYEADQKSMTFCRFFWGMVCSPVTLPVRLTKSFFHGTRIVLRTSGRLGLKALAISSFWLASRRTIVQIRGKLNQLHASYVASRLAHSQKKREALYRQAELEAQRNAALVKAWNEREHEEWLARRIHETEYGGIEQGPRPVVPRRPSLQTRLADGLGKQVDTIVAWFQDHPKVLAGISKFITRGVFYPLAFIIPAGILSFVGWQIDLHTGGLFGASHVVWSSTINGLVIAFCSTGSGLWQAVRVAGPLVLYAIGIGLGVTVLFCGTLWIMVKLDEKDAREVEALVGTGEYAYKQPDGDLRAAPDSLFFLKARDSVDRRLEGGKQLLGAAERKFAPAAAFAGLGLVFAGRKLFKGFSKVGNSVATVADLGARGLNAGAVKTGNTIKQTGSFFALAHHSIKYRTCPRIEIED